MAFQPFDRNRFAVNITTLQTRLGAALLAAVLLVAAFNVLNLNEAFGDGPPYYAHTVNMDKWSDPLPVLGTVDVIAALLVAATVYVTRRNRRSRDLEPERPLERPRPDDAMRTVIVAAFLDIDR